MFGFFKAKTTVGKFASVPASATHKILAGIPNAGIDQLLRELIAAGADKRTVRLELGAFSAFVFWVGAARALQKRKLSAGHFEELMGSFLQQLNQLNQRSNLDKICDAAFGILCYRFLDQRMELYTSIITQKPEEQVLPSIVDACCGLICNTQPSSPLKLLIQSNYLLGVGTAFDLIATTKFVT